MTDHIKPSLLFFGTSDFAVPALESLIRNGHRIAGVITNPDERTGRKQTLTPPPVKICAQKYNIPVFQPERLEAERFKKEMPAADIFIVAAYGKIIPKKILNLPAYGTLNIHPSLLPRWRGPAPIQYAILHGDRKTGVTIMQIDELMDHGPIILQKETTSDPQKMSYRELHDELARLGAELLVSILSRWIAGRIVPVPQNDAQATYSHMITKNDGRIDWSKPAEEIERMTRAFNPWPGAWTLWPDESGIKRIRIETAETASNEPSPGAPGYVWSTGNEVLVKTGKGSTTIRKLGIEGKRVTDAGSFLRGHQNIIGATLI